MQQSRAELLPQLGNGAGPDDGTVRLVHDRSHRPDRQRRSRRIDHQPVIGQQQGHPPVPQRARPGPQTHLDGVSAVAHPLGFDTAWDHPVGQAGTELDAGHPVSIQQGRHERPGRAQVLHPPAAAATGPAGRISERPDARSEQRRSQLDGVADQHLGPIPEVRLGDRGGLGIGLHRDHLEAGIQQGQCVGADTAAEIHDPADAGRREPGRVVRRDRRSAGLLQPGPGQQQVVGPRAQLGSGRSAQPDLGQGGRGQLRREGRPQRGRGGQRVRIPLARPPERAPPGRRRWSADAALVSPPPHRQMHATGSRESAPISSDDGLVPAVTTAAPRAAIIAPLSVHSAGRGERSRMPADSARSASSVPQSAVGRDPTTDQQVGRAGGEARVHGLGTEHVADGLLEAGCHVGGGHRAPLRLRGLHVPGDGRLQSREREVETMPFQVTPTGETAREGDRGRVSVSGCAVDVRPAGVRQGQQPGDLVVRLPGGVVDGGAELGDRGRDVIDLQQRGVSAGDQQGQTRAVAAGRARPGRQPRARRGG